MIALRTVLCPVDFSSATPRQVDVAADLCRATGARLVLHHNRHWLGVGGSVGWMRAASQPGESQDALEAKLQACLSRLPADVTVEPVMTEGPVARTVLTVVEAIDPDLVVLTAHGQRADDHSSITQRLLEEGRRAVLVLHEPHLEPRTPSFAAKTDESQIVLTPIDLGPRAQPALDVAFNLARTLPIELHLLHVIEKRRADADDALRQLRALVPDDLAERVRPLVEHGDPATVIPQAADRLSAACIVMGEQAPKWLGRWFRTDTPRTVLDHARCPVWYVPAEPRAVATGNKFAGLVADTQ
jgi:nucleotide-binding universal stress UspA family protein